ncbi:hypothetical protein [Shewanella litorisediminis]|uniref:Uncharacterized protein n=1 Tax=Shewanella litorisediminis TaxID=1173586 RepID=A0ABX7FYM5_9GAMM|nr:hypothetical protein [Shewanella litorisediminis]MCL2919268.1 hypothetical protein [Shewanella litorisediminis]QRH00140.1 hypothetical protein JQC75_09445 [Shewanella litorisediminis]
MEQGKGADDIERTYFALRPLSAMRTPQKLPSAPVDWCILPGRDADEADESSGESDQADNKCAEYDSCPVKTTFSVLPREVAGERETLPLKLLLPVTLIHLAVLGLLAWQLAPHLSTLSSALDEHANKPKALQSYLVFSAPKQATEQLPEANSSAPTATSPQPEQAEREQLKEDKPVEPALAHVPKEADVIKEESLPAEPVIAAVRRESLPPIEVLAADHEQQDNKQPDNTQSEHTQLDFSTPASRFMARQNALALTALSESYANQQTAHMNAAGRGMSELLPEMEVLLVPDADDFYKPNTLDSDIDPNRIVKSGDTCYRVVKVPTPLNPHAENLGYPFRCGEDRVKKALKEGINKYLALMGKQDLR